MPILPASAPMTSSAKNVFNAKNALDFSSLRQKSPSIDPTCFIGSFLGVETSIRGRDWDSMYGWVAAINNNCMNRITDDFKKNLASRYSHKEPQQILPVSIPKQIRSSEQRYMELFESINRPPTINLSPTKPNEERFASTIAEYSNTPSFIDSVLAVGEDALSAGVPALPLVEPPLLLGQKMPFEQAIRDITLAFDGQEYLSQTQLVADQFMDLEVYSTVLANLGRRSKAADVRAQAKGKAVIREASVPPIPAREQQQIQTDTFQLQEQGRSEAERMKKIDLILVQLITEKKRKNYMVDYEASMEMKLMELLEFILQDEPEYAGLDGPTKMRQVLRNLESFQGKTIEGQSKINLLRIFFEQFTALKKEKEEHFNTPMRKLENRQKQTKARPNVPRKPQVKGEFTQENSYTQKRSTKSRGNIQVNKHDEWMGSLS